MSRRKRSIIIILLLFLAVFIFNPPIRWVVIGLLRNEKFYLGKPTSYWGACLHTKSGWNETEIAKLIGGGKAAVPVLVETIQKSDDPFIRYQAIECLAAIGPDAMESFFVLVRTLNDIEPYVRCGVLRAMATISPEEAVPLIIDALTDPNWSVRREAVIVLGDGQFSYVDQNHIRRLLNDPDVDVKAEACLSLLKNDFKSNNRAYEIITNMLDNADVVTCSLGIRTLGKLGTKAAIAKERLKAIVNNRNHHCRSVAALALCQIGENPDNIVSVIIELLDDSDPAIRRAGLYTLRKSGIIHESLVPILRQMSTDNNFFVRSDVAVTLNRIRK